MSESENVTTTATEVMTQKVTTLDAPLVIYKLTAEQLTTMTEEELTKFISNVEGIVQVIINDAKQALIAKEKEVKEELVTWDVQFRQNQGISIQVALVGAVFILFEFLSEIGRLLGVK